MPHLDARYLDGKPPWCCLGHSPPSRPSSLKNGSFPSICSSTTTTNNVLPMTQPSVSTTSIW
ncbi:hypothetical protein LNQ52_26095 [Klebsiella pneumoniae subsp. pneumoniae]|nr:hypothetical protein [Klebsiella pneumoniae subsp. pneumoniae]